MGMFCTSVEGRTSTNSACGGVLVVEDDEGIRETTRLLLESEGFRVFTSVNGKEALEALHGMLQPCVILLDLMMPVMDGWEFVDLLRKDRERGRIPVVVVSAVTGKLKKIDVEGMISKPFDLDTLLAKVRRYCQ